MKRMEKEELLNCSGGGLFSTIASLVASVITLTKALYFLRKLRG